MHFVVSFYDYLLLCSASTHEANLDDSEDDSDSPPKTTTELCLSLFFDRLPSTIFDELQKINGSGGGMDEADSVAYAAQLFLALDYLHSAPYHVCHRDVKPTNLLVDPETKKLQLCDFGSAIVIEKNEDEGTRKRNSSYVCSRFYRAPGKT
jgi:serine/threonine protein kinase